ncbi:MAG: hypothetical protein ACRD1Y_05020 [Terriglobales bacterium]
MPALFCDLSPQASLRLPEYLALAATGEAVAVFWPAAADPPPEACPVTDAAALNDCFENERMALLSGPEFPSWLALDEFDRVLLVTDAMNEAEQRLASDLLRRGCESIELLAPAAVVELAQSWGSGRRTGSPILRA